jgi:hypothetical protein
MQPPQDESDSHFWGQMILVSLFEFDRPTV